MKISDIDANFSRHATTAPEALDWHDWPDDVFRVFGACEPQAAAPYCRLPAGLLAAMPEGVRALATHTAGMRMRFRTDSAVIAVKAVLSSHEDMSHMPRAGSSGFDLYTGAGHGQTFRKAFMPDANSDIVTGDCILGMRGMRDFTLNFPLYNGVVSLAVGLERGAAVEAPAPYAVQAPVVFYGSSITQGGCASRPGNAYSAMLSRMLDTDFINLGFSGSARGEPELAVCIASLAMSAFVLDYDHNAPDVKHLRDTHEAFFHTVRARHPALPVLLLSKPDFDAENREHLLRRDVVAATYRRAREAGDSNVYFIDGETLFGADMRDSCTVDGCHPNDLGFYRMAQAVMPVLQQALHR